ncbi:hypothetical protein BCR36DRAFT_310022, partial [Piromyces finnis]
CLLVCYTKSKEILKILLKYGINIIIKNNNGNTALAEISVSRFDNVIRYLIKKSTRVNISNNEGYTPYY